MASYAENVSIWWRHHVSIITRVYQPWRSTLYLFLKRYNSICHVSEITWNRYDFEKLYVPRFWTHPCMWHTCTLKWFYSDEHSRSVLMLYSLEGVSLKITSIIIKLLWSFFAKTWTYDRDNTCRYWIPLQHLNGNIVILTDFLHYLHQKLLKMKTSSAANDENFIESTFPLQWSASHKKINLQIFTQLSHCIHQQYCTEFLWWTCSKFTTLSDNNLVQL